MTESITAYIGFRYHNWMDYARHQCRVQHLEGWECDLMNDIIVDLMRKPESKLADLMSRETRKIVNGRPTTELDKFVLTMIKCNAQSHFASFRKNTVGQKIIATHGRNVEVAIFSELTVDSDKPDECTYSEEKAIKLDRMHIRNIKLLHAAGYSYDAINVYIKHFIDSLPLTKTNKIQLTKIKKFLTTND